MSWTELDRVNGYLALVAAARAKAGPESLASRELRIYAQLTNGVGAIQR